MTFPGSSPDALRAAGIQEHDKKYEAARGHSQRGDFERASTLFRENLAWSKKARGPRDPVTLEDQDFLSFNLHELGQYEQAEALDRRTLQVRRDRQGNRHEDTLETQHNLALNLFKLGRYTEAADLDRRTLRARGHASGLEDQSTLSSRHNLAVSLQELKLYGEAADLNRETLKIRERSCNEDDHDLIASRHNLALNLHGLGQYDSAADLLQRNLNVLKKTRTKDDLQLARNKQSLTINLNALGRVRNVEEDRERVHKNRKQAFDNETPQEQKILEQKDTAELETDQKATVRNAIRGNAVTDIGTNQNDGNPRHTRPQARTTAATYDSNNEASAGAEIQRSCNTKDEHSPRKENKQEEPRTSTRIRDNYSTRLGVSKQDGPASTPGPILSHKRASSASETVLPYSTRFETASTPSIVFPPEERNLGKEQASLPTPVVEKQRPRAKSDQNLARSCSSKETREAHVTKTTQPASAGPRLKAVSNSGLDKTVAQNPEQAAKGRERLQSEQRPFKHGKHNKQSIQDSHHLTQPDRQQPYQGVVENPNIKPTEAPLIQSESNLFSSLCDAHDSIEDAYVSKVADDWFHHLEMSSQALLEPYRKDRMSRVKIAILDTGIDRTHPQIEAQWNKRIKDAKSWLDEEGGDRDSCGHGTHGASLLMKVAPEAHIYVARVIKDGECSLNPDNVADAINHAADKWEVDIITMSFGFPRRYVSIEKAIDRASNKNIIMFAAARNSGANRKIAFPASSSSRVICINSADGGGARSRYNTPPLPSSHNFSVLGEAVSSAWPTMLGAGAEKRLSGTSTSTPVAAAIAALVLEFAKQPLLQISHAARLKSLEGMREIFSSMSESKDGYNCIVPWKLLDNEVGRAHVAFRISDILYRFFGAEDHPH